MNDTDRQLIATMDDLVEMLSGTDKGRDVFHRLHDDHGVDNPNTDEGVWFAEDGSGPCGRDLDLEGILEAFLEEGSDVTLTMDGRGSYGGARITYCTGGPSIWVDTSNDTVYGVWGSFSAVRSYVDIYGLHGHYGELYAGTTLTTD